MIVDDSEVAKYLSGKRIAVVFFNKDSRNLLRAVAAGLTAFAFSIEFLIDPTLGYRPRVRQLAKDVFSSERIVTDMASVEDLVKRAAFDAVLIFEAGYENQPQDHLRPIAKATVTTSQEFEAKCKGDYDNTVNCDPNAEFNARWSQHCVHFLVRHFSTHGILAVNAYNIVMPAEGTADQYVVAFAPHHKLLPTIPEGFEHVPVRYVLGEDWACGKTTYMLSKMRQGASGMAGDFWFRLVSPFAMPEFRLQDMFGVKGVIANIIRQASERNPGQPVFIKLDGRLEEFVYGFPRDRSFMIKDMHHYFADCRFAIVHKADSPKIRALVDRFVRKYEVRNDQIDRVLVHHDGRIGLL